MPTVLIVLVSLILAPSGVRGEDSEDNKPLHVIRLKANNGKFHGVSCVAFHPNGKTVYFGGGHPEGPGILAIVDAKTGKLVRTCRGQALEIRCVAVHPEGKWIATGGGDRELKIWDDEGNLKHSLSNDSQHTSQVLFSPDGKWLACVPDELIVRDTDKFERVHDTGKEVFGTLGVFTPDSKTLIGASARGAIRFVNVADWKTVDFKTKVKGLGYYHPSMSPDGKLHAVATTLNPGIDEVYGTEIWAWNDGKLGKKLADIPGHQLSCTFTPDSKHVLLGEALLEQKNRIRVLEAVSGKQIGAWFVSEPGDVIRGLALSRDGTILASCDDGHVGKIWDFKAILAKFEQQQKKR